MVNFALITSPFLADELTKHVDSPEAMLVPNSSSCLIIDGQALVATLGKHDNAANFGGLTHLYVRAVMKADYQLIDVVSDRYRDETIKGHTRKWCKIASPPIRRPIEGRDVPLPKNWTTSLSFPNNKLDHAHFLSEILHFQAPDDKEIAVAWGFRGGLEVRSSISTTDFVSESYKWINWQ